MSFSFNVRGANKAEALEAVKAEMAKVVAAQPIHAHDADSVQAVAETYVAQIPDPAADQAVLLGVSGWLQWQGSEEEPRFTGASVSVSATLIAKE